MVKQLERDLEKDVYGVYVHIFPNGKIYIGKFKENPEKRWGSNGKNYKQQFVYKAIEKYGWNNINHIIIIDKISEVYSFEIEKQLILKYMANNSKHWYNLTSGGDGVSGYKYTDEQKLALSKRSKLRKGKYTEETKLKISKAHKGKIVSEETREKLRNRTCYLKGKNHPFYGVHRYGENAPHYGMKHSEESKELNRQAHLGKKASDETKKKLSDAGKERFKNKENHPNYGKKLSEATRNKMSESRIGSKNPASRKIYRLDLITEEILEEFDTIKEAEIKYNTKGISNVLRGRNKTSANFKWKYKEI